MFPINLILYASYQKAEKKCLVVPHLTANVQQCRHEYDETANADDQAGMVPDHLASSEKQDEGDGRYPQGEADAEPVKKCQEPALDGCPSLCRQAHDLREDWRNTGRIDDGEGHAYQQGKHARYGRAVSFSQDRQSIEKNQIQCHKENNKA